MIEWCDNERCNCVKCIHTFQAPTQHSTPDECINIFKMILQELDLARYNMYNDVVYHDYDYEFLAPSIVVQDDTETEYLDMEHVESETEEFGTSKSKFMYT
jgi:hypothetical protein